MLFYAANLRVRERKTNLARKTNVRACGIFIFYEETKLVCIVFGKFTPEKQTHVRLFHTNSLWRLIIPLKITVLF